MTNLAYLVIFIADCMAKVKSDCQGALAATVVVDLVRGATASAKIGNPNLFANIARYAILGFAALIALEQLQIAPALLNILFTAIVGAAAIAVGLSFGLGGQDTARKWLSRGESTVSSAASPVPAQQDGSQMETAAPMQANQLRPTLHRR
jgi:hypothetical protein